MAVEMTQRNKVTLKECVCKSIYYILHNYAVPQVIQNDLPQTQSAFYPCPRWHTFSKETNLLIDNLSILFSIETGSYIISRLTFIF